jgi:hypothetical protein
MSRRSKIIAILLSLASCAGALFLLKAVGAAHRKVLAAPLVRQVDSAQEAFAVWRETGVRGRILVLIDRRLNAGIEEPGYGFSPEEFSGRAQLDGFCDALRSDLAGSGHEDFPCSVEKLNDSVMDRLSLYPLFLRKRPADPTGRIALLAEYLSLADTYAAHLPGSSGMMLRQLNRLVLERSYPGLCPQRPEYPVLPTTYVHQAVRAGIIRKIYHLIPGRAWNEVSSVLGGSRFVESSAGSFRTTIAEGVPVTIMRFGDLPDPEESVLVNVNTDSIAPEERALLPGLLQRKIRSDLTTVAGSQAAATVADLGKAHGTDH